MEGIFETFKVNANKRPQKPAFIYLGTTYTFGRLKELAERFAAALVKIGIKRGDRIILYIPHGIQWVVSWLGMQRIGVICVPISPIYTNYDLEYIADDCGAGAVVCADTNFGYVIKAMQETSINQVIVTTLVDLMPEWKRLFGFVFDVLPKSKIVLDNNIHSFQKLLSRKINPDSLPSPPQSTGEIIEIIYTGGTTKAPKGVPITDKLFLTHILSGLYIYEPLFPPETNIIANNAPLFHILGQNIGLAGLLIGNTNIIHPQVNLDIIFDAIQRYKVKTNVGVPALYRRMLEHPRLDQYDLSAVQVWLCGGDVLPVELGTRWREKFGRSIIQAYGTTETCGGVTTCPLGEESPPKSVGKVLSSKEVLLVDPVSLKPVNLEEPGELLVHSKYMVESYLNKPEETEKSFITLNGKKWYRTNDIMTMDKNGHLYFVDRTVDMIKHKGYRVSSSEIESILQEHPAVIGSIVVGVDDPNVGQRIKAFVVLKEDIKGITAYDLIKWCRERMPSYKVPQYIEFRDSLPKSKVGKFLKRDLRTEEEQRKTALHKTAVE
jgi:long-chain acyl-CoA synthetase